MLRRALVLSTCCTGLYCTNYFKRYYARCEDTNNQNDSDELIFKSDTLFPSFKAVLLKKIYNMDFKELKKQEVLIEIGLISIPLILTGIASSRFLYHTKRAWHRKDFYNIMNVSLNTIIRSPKPMTCLPTSRAHQSYKYTLYFRTLMEKELRDVLPNEEGIKQLIKAAKKTDEDNPFIIIKNPKNHWTVCNQIANQISSICAHSFIHRDIVYHNYVNEININDESINNQIDDINAIQSCSSGNFLSSIKSKNGVNIASNIETGVYLMALTCEPEQSARHRKIRVMLIQERMIQQLLEDMNNERLMLQEQQNLDRNEYLGDHYASSYNEEMLNVDKAVTTKLKDVISTIEAGGKTWTAKLEDPAHSARWKLITRIVEMYDKQEKRDNGKIKWAKPLCDLELCTMSLSDNGINIIQQQEQENVNVKELKKY